MLSLPSFLLYEETKHHSLLRDDSSHLKEETHWVNFVLCSVAVYDMLLFGGESDISKIKSKKDYHLLL